MVEQFFKMTYLYHGKTPSNASYVIDLFFKDVVHLHRISNSFVLLLWLMLNLWINFGRPYGPN